MAHVIKLKYGSPALWNYIDLTDSAHGNVDYIPGTPDEGADEIVESGTWRVAGSSVADLLAKITEIEQAFYKAGAYDRDEIGAYQVRLTILPDGTSDTWESQIFEGKLELTGNILGVDWANHATEVVLYWRRMGCWEKYTAISIHNSNGTLGTIVYNRADESGSAPTKKENWVEINAADVPGDLPAPTVIYLVPAAAFNHYVVIGNGRTVPLTTQPSIFWLAEGETGASDVTDAARSGGKYHNYVTPVGGSSGVDVSKVTTDLASVFTGAWLRYLLSASFTGTVYARPYFEIGSKRYYGPKSVLTGTGSFSVYDLGMIHFPSGAYDAYYLMTEGISPVTVGVNFIAASAITIAVDYFHYLSTDSYSKAVLDTSTDVLVCLDARNGIALGNSNAGTLSAITSIGTLYGGIWLEPNLKQRLYFKLTNNGLDVMANSATVTVYAWLRKRTL